MSWSKIVSVRSGGLAMNAQALALAAAIILLFPMLYFLLASSTFLLRPMSDPIVTWLLRGLLNTYFLAVVACGAAGALAFALAGWTGVAGTIALVAACALAARHWFLCGIDRQIRARDGGDGLALLQLRRLHVQAMLYNALQTGLVMGAISQVFAVA